MNKKQINVGFVNKNAIFSFQTDRGRKPSSSSVNISVGGATGNQLDLNSLLGGLGVNLGSTGVNLGSTTVKNVDKRIVNLPDGSQEIVTTTRDQNGREVKTVERVNRSGSGSRSGSGGGLRSSGVDAETSAKINSILSQFME